MRRLITCMSVCCVVYLAMAVVSYVSAQTPGQPHRSTQVEVDRGGVHVETNAEKAREMSGGQSRSQSGDVKIARVKDLVGLSVQSPNNESLGKVEDLVIDPAKGQIRYAVLSFGGFLGMGDKLFAVPWNELKLQTEGVTSSGTQKGDHYILAIDKETLKNAPGFDKEQWPNFADQKWSISIDKFYGDHRRATKATSPMR
jgi:sporulation protein YlmC with PRC-barrel domain